GRARGGEGGIGRWGDHVADLDIGHYGGHRYEIVRHVAVEQLSACIVNAMLEQRRANPLHDTAADLLVHEQWIYNGAAVLDAPVPEQLHETRVRVDFNVARLHAVGEGEGPGARHVVARRHELRLKSRRQRVGTEIGDAGELVQRKPFVAAVAIDHGAVAEVEVLRFGLQDRGSAGEDVGAQRLARVAWCFPPAPGRARGAGARAS